MLGGLGEPLLPEPQNAEMDLEVDVLAERARPRERALRSLEIPGIERDRSEVQVRDHPVRRGVEQREICDPGREERRDARPEEPASVARAHRLDCAHGAHSREREQEDHERKPVARDHVEQHGARGHPDREECEQPRPRLATREPEAEHRQRQDHTEV